MPYVESNCLITGLNSYACNCKYGFTGQHCEVNLRNNFCIAACDRFDSCRYDNNQTECVCPAGYTGSRCSFEINECNPSPCVQGEKVVEVNHKEHLIS